AEEMTLQIQPWLLGVLAAGLIACTPSPAQQRSVGETAPPPLAPRAPTRLTVAIGAELNNLATKLESANTYAAEYNFLTNSPLALLDERGVASAFLAAELPSRDAGTWIVNADGTMATTWRIRPNAAWHNGQPVTWRDFDFALKVYTDDAIAVGERTPERFMERIDAVDEKSF